MHGVIAIFAGSVHSLASVSLGALALAVALHVGKLSAEARAWHGIIQHAHDPRGVRFRTTYGAFVSSIGANAVLPARVGAALRVGCRSSQLAWVERGHDRGDDRARDSDRGRVRSCGDRRRAARR